MKYIWRIIALLYYVVIALSTFPLVVVWIITAPIIFIITGCFPDLIEDYLFAVHYKVLDYLNEKLM